MKTSKSLSLLSLLPLFLTLILLLALTIPMSVFAAGSIPTITINAPTGHKFIDMDVFEAYQIFSVEFSGNDGDGNPTNYVYKLLDDFNDFTDYPDYSDEPGEGLTLLEFLQGNPGETKMTALATALYSYIDDRGILSTGTPAVTESQVVITFDENQFGYYLVFNTSHVDGADGDDVRIVAACGLTTTAPDAEVTHKVDVPTITKEVSNGGENAFDDEATAAVGDTVDFKLTSIVPNMEGYTNYKFTVKDIMSEGLNFDINSVAIKLIKEGETDITLEKDTHYEVNAEEITTGDDTDSSLITINFSDFILLKEHAGRTIEITYSATLNEKAVMAGDSNPNRVVLDYSNNPYYERSYATTPPSITDVYSFRLNFSKIDGKTKAGMSGVEFQLKQGETTLWFLRDETNNRYVPAKSTDAGASQTLISQSDGAFNIAGLDAGTYVLTETKPLKGYNPIPNKTIVITHLGEGIYEVDGDTPGTITVENFGGSKLPGTGGAGVYIIYAISAIIAAGLIIFFISNRRKNILSGK